MTGPNGTGLREIGLREIGLRAIISGSVASVVSTAALAWLARAQGRRAIQPTNATSHWLHGEGAGTVERADAAHTLTGFATHYASAIFWAVPFEALLARGGARGMRETMQAAVLTSGLAAVVDYGLVPRRLTPGWESVLPTRSIAAAYVALAFGLALGGMISNGPGQRATRITRR
jgi:hypothetical protein